MQKIHDSAASTNRKRIDRPELLLRIPLEGSPRLALVVDHYADELRLRNWLSRASLPSLDGLVAEWAERDNDLIRRRVHLSERSPEAPIAIIAIPWGGPISAFLRGCRNEQEAEVFRTWLDTGPGTRALYRLTRALTTAQESA